MTKRQWFASKDPDAMLSFLEEHLTFDYEDEEPFHIPAVRKLRLFGVACCRHVDRLLTDNRSRTALDVMVRYLDQLATKKQLERAVDSCAKVTWELPEISAEYSAACAVCRALDDIDDDFRDVSEVASHVVNAVVDELPDDQKEKVHLMERVAKAQRVAQAQFLRDIFGNPFRTVTLDPAWLTSDVQALARQMYDSGDFSTMPILADALQDAGCNDEEILSHCRDPKATHVRGCWVLDLLLGK
jgi:hypothetical protein